jgi:hypothetical protein
MIYAEGNNREAVKIKRISMPIKFETGTVNYSRYYLPELPEVNKGKVVGIQTHIVESVPPGAQNSYETVPYTNEGNGSNIGLNWVTFLSKYTTLNLINNDDLLIIENFPLIQLSGYTSNINQTVQKIIPFDIKINTKKSYIYFFPPSVAGTTTTFYINLTFFYVE